ncbi:MAG: GTPase Era [Clostridia bacterium]|nr:GTPase Era [Clostridia bacterium]
MLKVYGDYEQLLQKVYASAAKKMGFLAEDAEIEVSFATPEEIRALNEETRGIDKVTDVLSFQNIEDVRLPLIPDDYPYDLDPDDGSVMLGEIVICLDRAKEQAEEYGHSLEREVGFLFCHGTLHLLGYDHEEEEGEKEMNDLTEKILEAIGLTRDFDPTKDELSDVETGDPEPFRSGFVAVLGKPNAGKSTLINTIVGEKVAIVSWKPQTTRNKILGVYNEKNCQIIFIDTPGLHKPKNSLGEYMMKTASAALEGVDCVLYVVDCEKGYDEKDKMNIVSYTNAGHKVVVAVNKVDHVTKEAVFAILTELNKLQSITAVVPISALRNRNIEPLKEEIKKLLTDSVKYYDDDQYTDRNMRFMASEIIREKALRLLDKEVPYGIGVDVRDYFVRDDGVIEINADIICEKPAHKPIILGKGGQMIKKIATYARQDLEDMTGSKVFLTVFVRVKNDWRDSDLVMRDLGYDPKNPD